MPISSSVRITRIAISPRFATRTFENMAAEYMDGPRRLSQARSLLRSLGRRRELAHARRYRRARRCWMWRSASGRRGGPADDPGVAPTALRLVGIGEANRPRSGPVLRDRARDLV